MNRGAEPGEPGASWRARNINSIKLRASDRKKHPVEVRQAEPIPEDEAARRARIREQAKQDAEARAEAAAAARRGAARERRRDDLVAERGHTPDGWVPANRRTDFRDPLSRRAADDAVARLKRQLGVPEPKRVLGAPDEERGAGGKKPPKQAKKPKRVRRPGN